MLKPMYVAVGKPNAGAPSRVLIDRIHVVCHTKTQKLFARHCMSCIYLSVMVVLVILVPMLAAMQ